MAMLAQPSEDDVAADLMAALDAIVDYSNASRPRPACLDEGQALMLAEAYRRIDQVFTELSSIDDFAGVDDDEDVDEPVFASSDN